MCIHIFFDELRKSMSVVLPHEMNHRSSTIPGYVIVSFSHLETSTSAILMLGTTAPALLGYQTLDAAHLLDRQSDTLCKL